MREALLAIDVGNTQVVVGVHDGAGWIARWRVGSDRNRTSDEWASTLSVLLADQGLSLRRCEHVAIASVVPRITTALLDMTRVYPRVEPFVVGPGVRTGVRILTENPREVGADRVVNALATHQRYGGPAIVVDFGTATTFDAISELGDYLGGAIAPGLAISSEALQTYTAKLQEVDLVRPSRAIGRNTVECMQSGIVLGYAGLVEKLVHSIKAELGPCKVIATGGLVGAVMQATDILDHVDPDLTLEGLRLMYELNVPYEREMDSRAVLVTGGSERTSA